MNTRTNTRLSHRHLPPFAGMLTVALAIGLASLSLSFVQNAGTDRALAAPLAVITGTATEFPTRAVTATATVAAPTATTTVAAPTATATPVPATATSTAVPATAPATAVPTIQARTPTSAPPPPGVPEPSTWLLLTTGFGGLIGYARLRRRR